MPQSPGDPVPDDRTADSLGHDEATSAFVVLGKTEVEHQCAVGKLAPSPHCYGEIGALVDPLISCKHVGRDRGLERRRLSREAAATLTTTAGQDGTACAGTHAEAETVGLRATTGVGLERPLAHCGLSL